MSGRAAHGARPRRAGPRRPQRGIGLLEILMALVVVSIGFLAAARMQLEGMRFSQSAYFQSQAYFLASEMIDRMRANVEGVDDGDYDDKSIASVTSDPGCGSTNCLPAQIARQDLYDWRMSILATGAADGVVGALPSSSDKSATATITKVADTVSDYEIELTWPEVVAGDTGEESLSVRFTAQAL